jgi:hypothetical protein
MASRTCSGNVRFSLFLINLKGFSTSDFFHESVSPKPLHIPFGPFQIFSKIRGDIYGSKCTTGVDTSCKWKKIFSQKNFNYFVWTG